MTKLAANISMMFTEVDFLDRFEVAAKAGFRLKKNLIKTVSHRCSSTFQQVIGMRVNEVSEPCLIVQENFKMELEWLLSTHVYWNVSV